MKNKSKKKIKNITYCKRCGAETKGKFNIQLTPSRLVEVCTECFNWANSKTQAEIRKDYKEKAKRKKNE